MRLRYTIGSALCLVHDDAGALPQIEKVVALSQKLLGRDDNFTLNAEYRLAGIHRQLRHFEYALRLNEDIVERRKAIFGQEHAQTLRAMNGLVFSYRGVGQSEKALELAKETLELRKRHLGPTHPDTLVSMNNVAWLYLDKQPEKALPLFEETLEAMREKLAPLHPERINTTANLARAYHAAEQIDKAVPLQEAVLKQFKTVHGNDDTQTQFLLDNLIAYYVDIGWCDKAEALLISIQTGGANRPNGVGSKQAQREKVHRDRIQRIRPSADQYQMELATNKEDHPDTLAARQAFAIALRAQKRHSASAYHLKAVLDARERVLLADHPDTHMCRFELGTVRLEQKKYAEAEPLLLGAYKGLVQYESKHLEEENRSFRVLLRLGQLYLGWDRKDKAGEWREKLNEQKGQ
jgi:tetratricopeptide (TPR) repeat protein